jgi:hypothetical protein
VSEFHFEITPKHAPLKSFIQIEEGMNHILEIVNVGWVAKPTLSDEWWM